MNAGFRTQKVSSATAGATALAVLLAPAVFGMGWEGSAPSTESNPAPVEESLVNKQPDSSLADRPGNTQTGSTLRPSGTQPSWANSHDAPQAPDSGGDDPDRYYPPGVNLPGNWSQIDPDGTVWCGDGTLNYVCGQTDPDSVQETDPQTNSDDSDSTPSLGPGRSYSPQQAKRMSEEEKQRLLEKLRKTEEENRRARAGADAETRDKMRQMSRALEAMTRTGAGAMPGGLDRPGGKSARKAPPRNAAARTPRPRAAAPQTPVSVASPRSRLDLALAAHSGYGHAFKSAGIGVRYAPDGAPAFVRRDGTPASERELSELRARILSEPAALMKRPDFFQTVSRERYDALKSAYLNGPAAHGDAFLHVGLTDSARDFRWDESCSKVGGRCNPNSVKPSYKKGELVEPESLDKMWEDVFNDEIERERTQDGAAARLAKSKLSRRGGLSSLGGILGRIGSAIGGIFGGAGGDSAQGAVLASMGGASAVSVNTGAHGASLPLARGASRANLGKGRPVPAASPPLATAPDAADRSRGMFWLLIAAGLGLMSAGMALIRERRR
jgi:hypothetical protein